MTDNEQGRWQRIRALFEAATALPLKERDRFLREETAGDDSLLKEVWQLLAADEQANLAIEGIVGNAADELATADTSSRLTEQVGNYRLTRALGSGGMGNVYLGERVDEQFDHKVAIKILQTGRSNALFVQRFRSERQVLARLEHPNICRLLDGGETEDGLPYLVMEYVRGVPIDTYCDEHQLDVIARLRLFQKVCLAVDHAHRNLVVHRDVKPSNILIADDGEPKLLDFGIAKLIDDSGVALGNITVESARMLTPEFASPEQVRGEPVAVATDVYSLGVLLYRLLCGRGPYRVCSDMPSDLARAILEDIPSKPSTALVTALQHDRTEEEQISSSRDTSVSRLRRRLQGDLDNIALMALRKESERRYSSAKALHDDIDNYLSHRPIAARADSLVYRTGKFVRRQRAGLTVTVTVAALLAAAVIQVVDQRNKAETAAIQAEQVTGFLAKLFTSASPDTSHGNVITASSLLAQGVEDIEQLDDQPAVQAELLHIMGDSYGWIGEHLKARDILQRAVAISREVPSADPAALAFAIKDYADNERLLGNFEVALQAFEESLAILKDRYGENHASVAHVYGRIGDVYRNQANFLDARRSLEAAVAIKTSLGQIDDRGGIDIRGNLALVIDESGDTMAAIEVQSAVVEASLRVDGDKHPNTMIRVANLGLMQTKVGLFEESLANNTVAYNYGQVEWSTDLRNQSWVAYNRGNVLRELGRIDEAEASHIDAVTLRERHFGVGSMQNVNALWRLGLHYIDTAQPDNAQAALQRAMQIATSAGEVPGRDAGRTLIQLARLNNLTKDYSTAAAFAAQAIEQSDHLSWKSILAARTALAVSTSKLGQKDEASAIFASVIEEFHSKTGEDTVAMLTVLLAATRHHRDLDDADAAMVYAERAYRVSEAIRPPTVWMAALVRGEYGLSLQRFGDAELAQSLLLDAHRDLLAVFGVSDWRVQAIRSAL
jgi:serine/threonine protein kinase